MLNVHCPKCFSTKLHNDKIKEDLLWCSKCDYTSYAEDFITQPSQVPYKYHYLNTWFLKWIH